MGERSAVTDKKLGLDYDVYNKMNHQAQRAALKCLDSLRKQSLMAGAPLASRKTSGDMMTKLHVSLLKMVMFMLLF